jgi:hypothetical protein
MSYDLTKDDKYDLELSQTVEKLFKDSQCYKSIKYPQNYKCVMPKLYENELQCKKIFEKLNYSKGWYNCFQIENKIVIIIRNSD